METLKAIASRFSCRKFVKGTMKEEDKRAILEAGMSAPSAKGASRPSASSMTTH